MALVLLLALVLMGCHHSSAPGVAPPILLFNGTGASPNDVKAVEAILKKHRLEYSTANSQQLNAMSEAELRAYRLIIIPGGNYITIGQSLSTNTTANIRKAVQAGSNYLGICAGGFLAGDAPSNSLNLTSGVRFDFYAALQRGVRKEAVLIASAGTPPVEHYWEDGPQFGGWGAVVGQYPDGTPAIVEGPSGKGWVVLCGVHPEAPDNWRHGMTFTQPARIANAYAGTLVEAALNARSLTHH